MTTPFNFELLKKRLNLFLEKIEDLGGEVEPLTIEKPATEEEIKAVEAKLGYTLPPHFREVLLENTAHLEFWWYIDDFTEEDEDFLPEELDNISSGELLFGLDLLLDNERSRKGWVKDVCPSKSEEYSRVWNNKMAFHQVGNGDYIAIELEPENYGKVVYVSHDGSENHGLYIADNFKEFLMNYAAVGCTGGEDWQWESFYTKDKGIDPISKNAKTWYKVLGINPKEVGGVKSKKMNNKKMKWIEYFSENGDLWQLFVEDDYQETQADTLAHNSNEAVTRREMPAIDKVQVTIIPAARIVDKVKGQVAGEKLFHLKLSIINGDDWFAISQQAFSKEEILQYASLFVGLNKFQAERVWKSKKLGEVNTIRLENKEETNN